MLNNNDIRSRWYNLLMTVGWFILLLWWWLFPSLIIDITNHPHRLVWIVVSAFMLGVRIGDNLKGSQIMTKKETPRLSEKAIAGIRAGIARAKKIPEGFDMELWAFTSSNTPCGTAGCLAYEITVADGVSVDQLKIYGGKADKNSEKISPSAYAANLIGVFNADDLFFMGRWPTNLVQEYNKTKPNSLDRALVVEAVTEFWIANDGRFPRESVNA